MAKQMVVRQMITRQELGRSIFKEHQMKFKTRDENVNKRAL